MANKLEPKYLARLARLEHLHPAAYRFLTRLEKEGEGAGLQLSTSTHLHVYKGSAFLMRVELEWRGPEPASLVLSPKPYLHIKQEARDRAELLFPRLLTHLVMEHGGYSAGWAPRGTAPVIVLKPGTPESFFEALFDALRELEM